MRNHIVLAGLFLLCLASLHPLFAFDSTDIEEVIAENSSGEIHRKADKARIMRNAGIPLSACGAISVPVGFILMATADITSWYFGSDGLRIDSEEPQAYIGLAFIATGLLEMGGGALCIVFGSKKYRIYKTALGKMKITYDSDSKSYGVNYSITF